MTSTPTPIALVLEDEREIRQFVRSALEAEGWQVVEAGTVRQGLIEAGTRRPDLVIADLGLPDGDGVDFIRELRTWSGVPVIVLSARTRESEKVAALDAGADDYITKPFNAREVIARLRAVMRRSADVDEEPVFKTGALEVDLAARLVKLKGEEVKLTSIEYALLRLLIKHAGKVVMQRQLLREVWGPQAEDQSHYLRVHFTHLRQKIDPEHTGLIKTEPRIGYRLEVP